MTQRKDKSKTPHISYADKLGLFAALAASNDSDQAIEDSRNSTYVTPATTVSSRIAALANDNSPTANFVTDDSSELLNAMSEDVPLSLIVDNPYNARRRYRQDVIAERAASLKKSGQLVPVIVMPDPQNPSRLFLIDGHYRYRARIMNGDKTIRAVRRPLESGEDLAKTLYVLSRIANEDRAQQTPLDDAEAWDDLIRQSVFENETRLAEHLGLSLATVNRTISILKLPDSIRAGIANNPDAYSPSICIELSKWIGIQSEEALDVLAKKIESDGLSVRKLVKMREALPSKISSTKEHSIRNHLHAGGNKEHPEIGTLRQWEKSNRIQVDIVIPDPLERERLAAALRDFIETNTRSFVPHAAE